MAAEDQRFAEHHGIDFKQLNEAIEDYRDGDDLRGASTISQQVAKSVFLWQGRSVVRKGLDAYFAVLIELCWPSV
ncbi:MAG: transglycosylase domain-containing protein [Gammaproteobacteria bacterium]